MVDDPNPRKRKSRAKGADNRPKGTVKIAAHKSDFSRVGEVKPKGSNSYVSTWTCTVCHKLVINTSPVQNAKPAQENHSATVVE